MMTKKFRMIIFSFSFAFLLASCGGGGGSTSIQTPPTKAIIKVSTANIPYKTFVSAAQFSIVLPPGVTPSVLTENDASGSVALSGKALVDSNGNTVTSVIAFSSYNSETRELTPGLMSGTDLESGEFLTITCSIASGTTVTDASFPKQATVVEISDSNVTPISGATIPLSVSFL